MVIGYVLLKALWTILSNIMQKRLEREGSTITQPSQYHEILRLADTYHLAKDARGSDTSKHATMVPLSNEDLACFFPPLAEGAMSRMSCCYRTVQSKGHDTASPLAPWPCGVVEVDTYQMSRTRGDGPHSLQIRYGNAETEEQRTCLPGSGFVAR